MSRYAFARRPRWILFHLLVLLAVVVMLNLAFWQLRRLDDKRAANDLITARSTATAIPIDVAVAPHTALDELRYRAVTATGSYDTDASYVIASRTQNGGPGGWVVTPLVVGDARVLVLRGFEKLSPDGSLPEPAPPSGQVTVDGYAMVIDRFDNIARHDLAAARDNNTLPVVLQAKSSAPADDPSLIAVPLPELSEGPHLSYAVQWFLFAAIAIVGYVLVMRREAGRHG